MEAKDIILLDLFSGTGGFAKGFQEAGYTFRKHYFSEIDKYAIANYLHNFKRATYAGSVEKINGGAIERPDIITFGFPCQDISVAGNRAGLEGSRSSLFFEAVRIIGQYRPSVFVFENVKGLLFSNGGKDFEIVLKAIADLGLYDCEWQLLNTRWFLPQNRERIYFVGHLRGETANQVFPFQESDFPTAGMETSQVAGAIVTYYSGTPNIGTYITDPMENGKPINPRKITPTECERLQGFPDDWTRHGTIEGQAIEIPDYQRYRLLGNAVSVPVVRAVASRLKDGNQTPLPESNPPAVTNEPVQEALIVDTRKTVVLLSEGIGALPPDRIIKTGTELKFIKRYLELNNQVKSPAAIRSFIKDLQDAIQRKRIRKTSPLANEIDLIQDKLIKAYSRMRGNERLIINSKDRSRLSDVVNGSSTKKKHKSELGSIQEGNEKEATKKETHSDNSGLGVLTAEQIANRKFEKLPFVEPWCSLMGTPAKNFTLMLHGEPGAGKTTLLLKFAEYLATNFGRVIYISSEEFEATTITDKVNELLNPIPSNLEFFVTLQGLDLSGYNFIILDSVNDLKLKLDDFKSLRKMYPDKAFILVLQHTKDGNYRGGKDWEHEIQIAGEVKAGSLTIYRNRYRVKGALDFFTHFNIKATGGTK